MQILIAFVDAIHSSLSKVLFFQSF